MTTPASTAFTVSSGSAGPLIASFPATSVFSGDCAFFIFPRSPARLPRRRLRMRGSRSEHLQVPPYRGDAVEEIRQVKFFVGSMQIVVGQSETHHYAGNAGILFEDADDGDRSAGADVDGLFAKHLGHRLGRRLNKSIVCGNQRGSGRAEQGNLRPGSARRQFFHCSAELRIRFLRLHVSNQAHADFGRGARGDHRLGSFPDEAAPNAMDLESGAGPGSLENREAGFTRQLGNSDLVLPVLLLVKRKAGPGFPLRARGRTHTVIKARDEDFAISVLQPRKDLGNSLYRVGRDAAVDPGVEVVIRAG